MVDQYVVSSRGVGTIQRNLYWPSLRRAVTLVPPPDEQAAIVRFLDHMDRKIKKYIRAKQKLIKLLEEQKQAIIHRTVTRGLDPDVRLKPSGVPWIGDMPAHWSLLPNRSFLRIRKKLVGSRHGEYQLLSLTKNGVLIRDMELGGKFSMFWERSQEVRPGDLVFCLFDVEETPRTVGLSRHSGMISGDYTVLECDDQTTAAFVECLYKAMDDRKLLSPLYMGLRKRIRKPEFLAVPTPIPPREERIAIVEAIEKSFAEIERSAEKLRREIGLVAEYSGRLIADVVTGKVDVRNAAEALPDRLDDLDSVDLAGDVDEAGLPGYEIDVEAMETSA